MNLFPLEIVHRILAYDGRIKYRNGKYMNQISPEDDRYEMLLTIPIIRPQRHSDYMQISIYRKNVVCKKHMYPYTGTEPLTSILASQPERGIPCSVHIE